MCAELPVINSALSLPSPDHLCTVEERLRTVFPAGFPAELARGEVQRLPESGVLKERRGHYCWAQLQSHTCDKQGLDPPRPLLRAALWISLRSYGSAFLHTAFSDVSSTSPLGSISFYFKHTLFPETPLSSLDLDF